MRQSNKPETHTGRRLRLPSHWNWRNILYLAMGISLCLWGPTDMALRKSIYPSLILVFVLGIAVLAINCWNINFNRERSRDEKTRQQARHRES